jgi:hypothetical protein
MPPESNHAHRLVSQDDCRGKFVFVAKGCEDNSRYTKTKSPYWPLDSVATTSLI